MQGLPVGELRIGKPDHRCMLDKRMISRHQGDCPVLAASEGCDIDDDALLGCGVWVGDNDPKVRRVPRQNGHQERVAALQHFLP